MQQLSITSSLMAVCLSVDNNNMTLSQELPPHYPLTTTLTNKCSHTLTHTHAQTHTVYQPFLPSAFTLPPPQHQPSHTQTHTHPLPTPTLPDPPRFAEAPACPGCTPGSLAPPCWMEEAMNRLSKSDLPQLFSVSLSFKTTPSLLTILHFYGLGLLIFLFSQ